ncbi:hypothetical protein [Pseudonocardia sp. TRM90224]|uniref:hypothetical protein n=1 Tax=Pseudonocardia sp. TRM90224 TaxID=2812678 RepID=UPI001E37DEE7|nr:hypothetical protein [Pseudonocardia sp. TRM90224]
MVSVAWVDMPDDAGAVELKRIVDAHGTGIIVELSREVGRHRGERDVPGRSGKPLSCNVIA